MSYTILPLGDSALIIDFGNHISEETNSKVIALTSKIAKAGLQAIRDIVPAYSSISIHYNPLLLLTNHNSESAFHILSSRVKDILSQAVDAKEVMCRSLNVPVCYSLQYGLDLMELSAHTKLSIEEIISLHAGKKYKVYMIGFLPGFAYMGNVDERIAVPRRMEPRQKIAAGSVGIAGRQTGIYPLTSPGGWQIIGKTPIRLFDKNKEHPVFFRAGDEVTFYPITEHEFNHF